ncbi:MAG: hydrogenase maturation protease [candidate division WOR-3 bacterium]
MWEKELEKFVDKQTVIMGIGSELKSDDGIGVFVAKTLKERGFNNVIVAGSTPEHWIGFLLKKKFKKLLIIDAVIFEGKEGEIKIFDLQDINGNFGLTHASSLNIFYEFLSKESSIKELKILAVMPKSLNLEEGLSKEVEESALKIIKFFNNFLSRINYS